MVGTHQPGQAVFKSILPEDIDWKPFPAFPPLVRLAVVVGDPLAPGPYTIRVKVPAGVKLMPHRHPEDRVYTVLSGVFYIGLGDQFDGDKVDAYPPGSVIVLPGSTFHFHWAKSGEYVTQVTAIGPLGIEYLDPGDDPREQNQSVETFQAKPMKTIHTIGVEHIRIESTKSFAEVRAALERNVPSLDPTLVKALAGGDVERANREKQQGPELSIFGVRDHGALLAIAGKPRNALQYEIGNPVTASLMTRRRISAALYAPIRVVLYENDAGHGVFEYDQPSTTFGQFGDEQVTAVARGLDAALARSLLGATG
jgi:hypothetical protein